MTETMGHEEVKESEKNMKKRGFFDGDYRSAFCRVYERQAKQ